MALVLFMLVGTVAAQTSDFSIVTAKDDLVLSRINGYDFVEVLADKAHLEGAPGEPWLPVRDVHILLPAGSKVASVSAVVREAIELDGTYRVYPAQPPVRISDPGPHPFVEPDPAIYARALSVRPAVVALLDTVIIRGYHVALIRIHPVDYVPATGRLSLRTIISLSIELDTRESVLSAFTAESLRYKAPAPSFEGFLRDDVINGDDLPLLGYDMVRPLSPTDPNDVKYLLIGDSSMFDEFQPLLDWKTKKGVPAEAVDVSWVYSHYSGNDHQEQIKACIKDYVQNKGTVWVVLGGDNTIVPDRDCYGDVNSGGTTDATIPTDLYYAGLDDMDWDDDDDGVAAEVGDDTIDMGPDVYVGRLPIRTEVDATSIVAKTLQYDKDLLATGFAEKMILAGVMLWDPGDAEAKSEGMYDDWIDPYWDPVRYRFYDTNTDFTGGASYDVTVAHMDEQLGNGYNLFHMATHGSQTAYSMEVGGGYYASDAFSVDSANKYTNILTMACNTNAFEDSFGADDPCLSEGFIRNPGGGAVSYIGGSRYGWGYSGTSAHGPSLQYDRMFYQFLFTGDPSTYPQQVGAVYTRMKEYWIGSSGSYGAMRWCQFSVNLMGDPELCLYTYDPSTFNPSFESTTFTGPQTFVVETGVPNALVCLSKGSEVYTYGPADGTGHYEASIDPTAGTLHVTMTAPNHDPFEGTVNVVLGSAGIIRLDRVVYSCSDMVGMQLADVDLQGHGTQDVVLTTTGGDTETPALTETGSGTGIFEGSIATSAGPASVEDGVLQTADGETITATYIDADDGQGGTNVEVTDGATLDCQGPVITNVLVADVGSDSATVTFDTNEPAIGTTHYGLSCGSLTESATESYSATSHTLVLTDLDFDTDYFFAVEAVDDLENSTIDDNGGDCYSFSTPNVVYHFPLDSDPGWSMESQWEFGPATAGGSYNGDPGYAHTGTNVYGYNLGGDYTNNLPATYLTTTALDCTGLVNVNLTFRRWLGVESNSHYDEATIEVSHDGSDWTVIWRATDLGADVADTSWQLQEFNISSVADNEATVYVRWGMGPTDGGLTYPGWNIDDVQIIATPGPLAIGLPDGPPEVLPPLTPTDVTVRIVEGNESYVPGSGTLHYRYDGGAFLTSSFEPLGGEFYEASLPGTNCDATPEFYFSAEGSQSGVVHLPATAPAATFTAVVGELVVILQDDFETDQGWTAENLGATSGDWQRGVPVNDPDWAYDPASDSDGSGQCYLTQNEMGNTDVDDGAVRLTSPTIDMSIGGITISYDYFLRLTNTAGGVDLLLVEIDGNGGAGPWIEIARHDTDGGLSWRSHEIAQEDLDAAGVTLTSTMQIRFTTNDADEQSINESGLDAFLISGFGCDTSPACDDGIQNQGEDRIDCGGPCTPCDCTGDGACQDGEYCNGTEICDDYGHCQSGSDPCPGQMCDEVADACVDCLLDEHCEDGLYCNGQETCVSGTCHSGSDVDCDDGVGCTDDSCNETSDSCDNVPNDSRCDNGLYCDGAETCDADLDCQAGSDPCPGELCNEDDDICLPLSCDSPAVTVEGSRYLAIIPPAGTEPVALLVTGDPDAPAVSCVSLYVQEDGTLDTGAVFKTPGEWSGIYVRGEEILPDTKYNAQINCGVVGHPVLSDAVSDTTWAFGDVNGDTVANLNDVLLILRGFQGDFAEASLEAVDIASCMPDGIINLEDILRALDAFQEVPFEDVCPVPCG